MVKLLVISSGLWYCSVIIALHSARICKDRSIVETKMEGSLKMVAWFIWIGLVIFYLLNYNSNFSWLCQFLKGIFL